MKVSVWTKRNVLVKSCNEGMPKCIFIGEVQSIPNVGDYVVVRDGFCAELVESIIHDFVRGEVEIQLSTPDIENEYGDSLT